MRRLRNRSRRRVLKRNDAREARRQEMGRESYPSRTLHVQVRFAEGDLNVEVRFKATQVSDAEVALILRSVADEIDDEPAASI